MSELSEIQQRLARVEGDVEMAREDSAVARHLAAETDRDIADVQQTQLAHTRVLNALRENQIDHGHKLTDLRTTQIEQRSEFRKIRATQREQGRQVEEIRKETTASFAAVDARFDKLESSVDARFDKLESKFDEIAALIKRSGKTA